jgi:hypothetical protein
VELSPGAWTITVGAFTGSGEAAVKAAEGSAEVTVSVGKTATAAITLAPYTGEGTKTGTFTYTVDYPAGLNKAQLFIAKADGNTLANGTIDLLGENKKTGTLPLDAGSYRVQVRLEQGDLIAGKTESLHIYPTLTTPLAYSFTHADFVAFAEVANVTVTGTAPYDDSGSAVNAEVAVTLYNESFGEAILQDDPITWITNLPAGLSVAAKSDVDEGGREIRLKISGTPANKTTSSEELAITIPGDALVSGKALTVRSNLEAKFDIGLPEVSATIGADGILAGLTTDTVSWIVDITLKNARTNIASNASLSSWFTNLPAGLSAIAQEIGTEGKTVKVAITGQPKRTGNGTLDITIPVSDLDRGPLSIAQVPQYSITVPPSKTVYIAGHVQPTTGYVPMYPYVWKYSLTGERISVSTTEDPTGGVSVSQMVVDNNKAVHLIGRKHDGTSFQNWYQKDNEEIFRTTYNSNFLPKIGLAPDDGSRYIAVYNVAGDPTRRWWFWKVEEGTPEPAEKFRLGGAGDTNSSDTTNRRFNTVTGIVCDEEYIYIGVFKSPNPGFFRVKRSDNFTAASYTPEFHKIEVNMSPQALVLSGEYLHIAGYQTVDDTKTYARYVKVAKSTGAVEGSMIGELDQSQALDIAVSESGDVYLTGYWRETIGTNLRSGTAVYWKVNGNTLERHSLTTTTSSSISGTILDQGSSIALDGGDLYIAGYTKKIFDKAYIPRPAYWKVSSTGEVSETILYGDVTKDYGTSEAVAIVVR